MEQMTLRARDHQLLRTDGVPDEEGYVGRPLDVRHLLVRLRGHAPPFRAADSVPLPQRHRGRRRAEDAEHDGERRETDHQRRRRRHIDRIN